MKQRPSCRKARSIASRSISRWAVSTGMTDGLRLLEKLHCKTPIIIVSGATSTQLQLTSSIGKSLKLNVCETISKPLDPSRCGPRWQRSRQSCGVRRHLSAGCRSIAFGASHG